MRAQWTSGARPSGPTDREVWRRSQETEVASDEVAYLMDLAAFAENRLDEDETARVAALIASDPEAANDVAAARLLANAEMPAYPDIVARAEMLVGEPRPEAVLLAFPLRQTAPRPWYSAASWSGLAAAVVLAGWLGFDLGSGISTSPVFSRPADDTSASELLDPSPLLRDFTENSQI
jgi:anti-sigma factor RsiW